MLAWKTYDFSILLLLVFVLVAAWIDWKQHRIPNVLTGTLLLSGFVLQSIFMGMPGVITALLGMTVGLLIFLPFWLAGGMGAGDVKLMAAIGTFSGGLNMLLIAGFTLASSFIAGIWVLVIYRGLQKFWSRQAGTAKALFYTGQLFYEPPHPEEAAARRFPFAVAIAVGTIAALAWLDALSFAALRMFLVPLM